MPNNYINNVDIDLLPDHVQDVILKEFHNLSTKHKLIVYSKLIHGHLFKVTANDLFNINKQTPGVVYRKFIQKLSVELLKDNVKNEPYKSKITKKRCTNKRTNKHIKKKISTCKICNCT